MSRLTVRPSAEIGSRKGSAAIASSGKDSGRRWMITHRTANATAAPATASTASTVVVVASITHTRASLCHQREAAGSEDRAVTTAQAHAHAVVAGGCEAAAIG